MFKSQYPCVHIYLQSLILKLLLILMFVVDFFALLFTPLWVLILFLIFHVSLLVFWIRIRCRLLDAVITDLFDA